MGGMQDQLIQMGIIFGTMNLAKRFHLDSPEYASYLLAAYCTSMSLTFALSFYYKMLINQKNDSTILEYTEPQISGEAQTVRITVREHDLKEVTKAQRASMISVAIVSVMYFKFGYVQPLLIQSILPIFTVIKSQLFQVYILGRPTTGDLARPWKQENPFAPSTNNETQEPSGVTEITEESETVADKKIEAAEDVKETSGKSTSTKAENDEGLRSRKADTKE